MATALQDVRPHVVFQQLEVPKKITVASPKAMEPSERFSPWIGKFGLESSSKESCGASFRPDAAPARGTQTVVICTTKASTAAKGMAIVLDLPNLLGLLGVTRLARRPASFPRSGPR